MNRRAALVLLSLALAAPLGADVLVLNDGRKLSGPVKEKPDGFEITVEGQTLSFGKDEARHFKSPKDFTGDAEKNYEDAKKIYTESVSIEDGKQAEAKMREALPKVTKAREAYAEARDLFPEGHPDLDAALVNVMKLMRLVREKLGSQIASGGVNAPPAAAPPIVKAKESPPPAPVAVDAPKPPPPVEVKPTASAAEAFAILVDPVRRADAGAREGARALFKSTSASDYAMAGYVFLSRDDYEWGLVQDVVDVKGGGAAGSYRGRLIRKSDALQALVQADRRELRLRTAADGTYVTPPGGSESKATDVKISPRTPSTTFLALQEYFKALDLAKIEELPDVEIAEGVKFLSLKTKELRGKGSDVESLTLFVAALASGLIAKNKGTPTKDLEAAFKDLGWEKSEYGAVWGTKAGLAMDDYRKWMASGEYGLAVVQFQNDYKGQTELNVRYALGLLMMLKSLADNRAYNKAAAYLELQARSTPTAQSRDHLVALAKSVRDQTPCMACGGTHKINCNFCKGKTKLNLQCGKCGGSGSINTFNGVKQCLVCKGAGGFKNVDCTKCAVSGKIECKARGCGKAVAAPTFESFAEAYKCGLCRGMGSVLRHAAYPCPECSGIGLILQPKADPTKLLK
ncbi:MAG TPA: hypothetical protein VF950_08100 [Planctomycetota bacterium]